MLVYFDGIKQFRRSFFLKADFCLYLFYLVQFCVYFYDTIIVKNAIPTKIKHQKQQLQIKRYFCWNLNSIIISGKKKYEVKSVQSSSEALAATKKRTIKEHININRASTHFSGQISYLLFFTISSVSRRVFVVVK